MAKTKYSLLTELRYYLSSNYNVIASDSNSRKQIRMYTVSLDENNENWVVRFVVVGFQKNGYQITKTFDSIDDAVDFYEKELK